MGALTGRTLAALSLLALLPACASESRESVHVSDAWARASAPGQTDGALYFSIESADDDVLSGVGVPEAVADHAELHEEVADAEGRMTMRHVDGGVALSGGDTTLFEPGGLHVMLVDLAAPLVDGESFDATFDFERADPVTVTVTIAESAP